MKPAPGIPLNQFMAQFAKDKPKPATRPRLTLGYQEARAVTRKQANGR